MRFITASLCIVYACAYPVPSNYSTDESENSIAGIEIIVPSREFTVGDDIPARCVLLHIDGTRKEAACESIRWECSDEKVCTVIDNTPRAVGRGSTLLRAAIESFSDAKPIFVIAPPDYSKILISEVYYEPAQLADAEFIEVWNTSDDDIDLSGCAAAEGGGLYSYTLPSSTIIRAHSKLIIPRNRESFFQEFQFYPDLPSSNITLGNSGETVVLYKPDGTIIDIVFLEGGDAKCPQPDGWCNSQLPNAPKGYSATRISPENSRSCADWESRRPTPGE